MAANTPDFVPQGKVELQMQLLSAAQKPIDLVRNGLTHHLESTLCETLEEIPVCYHRLHTEHVDIVDKTLKSAMVDGNPFVRWRIGFVTPQQAQWLPWQNHQIVHYAASIHGLGEDSGHNFEMSTANILYTMNRTVKIVSRSGPVSDMVAGMAQDAGVQAVVEPTVGSYQFYQVNESDVEFILRRLLSRAVNQKGRGQYLFYVRDNVLHFHTPDYQTQVKQLFLYGTPWKRMAEVDRSQQLFDKGIAGTRIIVYNPYTGQSAEVVNDPAKYLRLAQGIYLMSSVPNTVQTLLYHLGTNRPDEAAAIAQNVYSDGRSRTFEMNADIDRSLLVQAGDLLQFVVSPMTQKVSPWSGYYLVSKVTHYLKLESLRTVYTLRRGEIVPDPSTVTQPNTAQQLVPVTTAPGQDISLAAVQNSMQTAGTGQQQGTSNYGTVMDPNAAPD
jgi:hypothetical protein